MIQNAIKGISMFVFCYSALYQTDRKFSSFAFLEKNYTQKPPTPPPHPPQKTPSSTKVPKASRKEKFQRETKILRLSPSLKLRSTGVPTPPPGPNLRAKHCDRCMKVVGFLLQNRRSYSAPTDRCTKDVSLF